MENYLVRKIKHPRVRIAQLIFAILFLLLSVFLISWSFYVKDRLYFMIGLGSVLFTFIFTKKYISLKFRIAKKKMIDNYYENLRNNKITSPMIDAIITDYCDGTFDNLFAKRLPFRKRRYGFKMKRNSPEINIRGKVHGQYIDILIRRFYSQILVNENDFVKDNLFIYDDRENFRIKTPEELYRILLDRIDAIVVPNPFRDLLGEIKEIDENEDKN